MTKHSFRTTNPVKEPKKLLADKELKRLSELLTKTKTVKELPVKKEAETNPNFAQALIEGLETNNYNLFGELLLEKRQEDKQKQIKNSKELINEFSEALIAKDLTTLSNLLADDGVFMVINKTLQTVAVIKEQYVNWLRFKLQSDTVTSVDMDTCARCSIGKTIILYNNGRFPWKANNISEATKGGLDFEFKNGKISQIKFCYNFTNTKNPKGFEKRYEIYKAYLAKGYDKKEANRLSEEEWNNGV